MLGSAVGHPGRGVPTEYFFGTFITTTLFFNTHKREQAMPAPFLHLGNGT